jgi:hypothetical protein
MHATHVCPNQDDLFTFFRECVKLLFGLFEGIFIYINYDGKLIKTLVPVEL